MAHVMNYEEILSAAQNNKLIYVESALGLSMFYFDGADWYEEQTGRFLTLQECDEEICEDYNWIYRCWDERPSEELRKQTPWKENPYE